MREILYFVGGCLVTVVAGALGPWQPAQQWLARRSSTKALQRKTQLEAELARLTKLRNSSDLLPHIIGQVFLCLLIFAATWIVGDVINALANGVNTLSVASNGELSFSVDDVTNGAWTVGAVIDAVGMLFVLRIASRSYRDCKRLVRFDEFHTFVTSQVAELDAAEND
jgi:hypothetical protein